MFNGRKWKRISVYMRETITINIKSIRYLNENTSVLRAWKLILPVLRARELVHGIDVVNDRFYDNYFKRITIKVSFTFFSITFCTIISYFYSIRRCKSFARERWISRLLIRFFDIWTCQFYIRSAFTHERRMRVYIL